MRPRWSRQAACIGIGPAKFFPTLDDGYDNNQGSEAKAICAGCGVRAECLDLAIRRNEQHGIWGGVGLDRRRGVRKVFLTGDTLAYQAALAVEMDELARSTRGATDTRADLPAHACDRCGDPVPSGRYPPDRNGPDATCGVAATYNRGCRCRRCADAKRDYTRQRRAARSSGPGKMDASITPRSTNMLTAVPEPSEADGVALYQLTRVDGTDVVLPPEIAESLFVDPFGWRCPLPEGQELSLPEAAGAFRTMADVERRIRWAMGDLHNYMADLWPEAYSAALDEIDFARGTARNWGHVCAAFPREHRDRYDQAVVTDSHWLVASYGETSLQQRLHMLDHLETHPMSVEQFKQYRDAMIDLWAGSIEVEPHELPEVTDPLTNENGQPVMAKTMVISFKYHPHDIDRAKAIKKAMEAARDQAAQKLGVDLIP